MQKVEKILWHPPEELVRSSHVNSLMQRLGARTHQELWEKSVQDIGFFWDQVMQDLSIRWFRPYDQVVDKSQGIAWSKWFIGGKLNIVDNCLDRHQSSVAREREAVLWEGDEGKSRRLTYGQLDALVCRAANALKSLGIGPGDTVAIVMPMVPEVVVQLFACLKIGAVAIPIFSGFGAEAIASRLEAAQVKAIFTSDIAVRRGKAVRVKETVDQASENVKSLRARIVFRRGEGACAWNPTLDRWWEDFVLAQSDRCETTVVDSEARSLILFTSGTTGKPKGAIHTHAGCLAQIGKELRYAFNVDEWARFFWFTDIGWMMGPWEMIGVTLLGGTLFLFEGAPDYPSPSRLWEMIDRHQLTHLGISPTAIRLLMRYGREKVQKSSLQSLRILGSTGEPWDPESYLWYFQEVGRGRCPIINISGGTEIIGCLLSPLPVQPLKPCSLGSPGLGVDADVFDEEGHSVRGGIGHLVCKQPLPSMTKGFLNDTQRYLETYFSRWPQVWYHGDWAHVDSDNHWFLHGRSDDTIKVAGKRIGPVEYEAALLQNDKISEAAAIGIPDTLKGEVCVCFAVPKPEVIADNSLRQDLHRQVEAALGKAFSPKEIRFVKALPKTRSAKILRGLIRKIYLREALSDTSSVENLETLAAIRDAY